MDAAGSWRVASLSPSRRDDYLAFFDHERERAFADNPAWSRCYCHYFHLASAIDWSSLSPDANRAAIAARIDVGEMEGFLAQDDAGRIVGWLNAQPRHKLPHCFTRLDVPAAAPEVPAHEAAIVLCFVVDPLWRPKGVERALLEHALASFAQRGIRVVDAFPSASSGSAAAHDRGSRALYESLGFADLAHHGDTVAMRKLLQ